EQRLGSGHHSASPLNEAWGRSVSTSTLRTPATGCQGAAGRGSASVRQVLRVRSAPLSAAERAGGAGGAFGNPSSYVVTGAPTVDMRAVCQTVRSGFRRPQPPPPPRGAPGKGGA